MVYRIFRVRVYIGTCQMHLGLMKKGKTMSPKTLVQFMWDFPVRIFNIAREKIVKTIADRAQADERWLNG